MQKAGKNGNQKQIARNGKANEIGCKDETDEIQNTMIRAITEMRV